MTPLGPITGAAGFDHLGLCKVVSARFFLCKVAFFPFAINDYLLKRMLDTV